jgi:VCBS repeat-containing protein
MRHAAAIAVVLTGLAPFTFAQAAPGLTVQGPGHEAVQFDAAALSALAPLQQRVVIAPEHGNATIEWSGPLLWTVLVAAHAVDPAKFGQEVRQVVRVQGSDGYVADFVMAEISPDFGNHPVQLATARDGTALPIPRLIVPGEKRGGRSVRDVVRIEVEQQGSAK